MADPIVTNWFGNLVSHPKVIVDANSVDDIVAVLKDAAKYPAPVRAVGSNHSTTPCGVAEGGTLIRMKMNRILEIGADTMRVEAGARHIDMGRWPRSSLFKGEGVTPCPSSPNQRRCD
jgi:FAD/FMN-containing dehydrogenase